MPFSLLLKCTCLDLLISSCYAMFSWLSDEAFLLMLLGLDPMQERDYAKSLISKAKIHLNLQEQNHKSLQLEAQSCQGAFEAWHSMRNCRDSWILDFLTSSIDTGIIYKLELGFTLPHGGKITLPCMAPTQWGSPFSYLCGIHDFSFLPPRVCNPLLLPCPHCCPGGLTPPLPHKLPTLVLTAQEWDSCCHLHAQGEPAHTSVAEDTVKSLSLQSLYQKEASAKDSRQWGAAPVVGSRMLVVGLRVGSAQQIAGLLPWGGAGWWEQMWEKLYKGSEHSSRK